MSERATCSRINIAHTVDAAGKYKYECFDKIIIDERGCSLFRGGIWPGLAVFSEGGLALGTGGGWEKVLALEEGVCSSVARGALRPARKDLMLYGS